MRTECIIGIKFEEQGGLGEGTYYKDLHGLRKPFLFHLTGTNGHCIDSKCFGIIFNLCNALAKGDEDPVLLNVIATDKKEIHEGWIEIHNGREINGLSNYQGETAHGGGYIPYINLSMFSTLPNPEYIYLKKI